MQDQEDQQPYVQNEQPSTAAGSQQNNSKNKNSKELLLLILLVAAVAVIAFSFFRATQETSDEGAASGVMEVSITEDGFNPSTVLIRPGTTVKWVNEDNDPHWVASNPHPEHDGLAGLDAGEPVGPGGTYSYTFEDSGTYGYHDHLNPETSGQVVVE